jgi:tetratricopeptide (TPR) repeat protein
MMIRTMMDMLSTYYQNGDWINVEAITRAILAAVPDDHVSLQFLGLVYYKTGRVGDAVRIFNRLVNRDERASELKLKRGKRYLSRGDYTAAAACYEEATRLDPKLATAWHDLGTTLIELGQHQQAVSAFRSALIAHPTLSDSMLALGTVGWVSGDLAAAEEGFAALAALLPDNIDAAIGLARVHRRRREFTAARSCYRRAAALQADAR